MKYFKDLQIGDELYFLSHENEITPVKVTGVLNPDLKNGELLITLLQGYPSFTLIVPYLNHDIVIQKDRRYWKGMKQVDDPNNPLGAYYTYVSADLQKVQDQKSANKEADIARRIKEVKTHLRKVKKIGRNDYDLLKHRILEMFNLIETD